MDKLIGILLLFVLYFGFTTNIQAQNRCTLKKICDDELLQEFDFRGQTTYTQIETGDTISLNIVAYARQELKIFACFEDKRTDNYYKIYLAKSIPEKKVRMISGNDTIFDVIKKTQLEEIFDSRKSATPFWRQKIMRSSRYIIQVISPPANVPKETCVNIMIGKRSFN